MATNPSGMENSPKAECGWMAVLVARKHLNWRRLVASKRKIR